MKYVLVLGDGMADLKVEELGNRTPLAYADKPGMDYLAKRGTVGMVKTIPHNYPMGSDVANLSVMGYDPREYYTGRSPIEAVSMGIEMSDTDVAVRCNLVTLSNESDYINKKMLDYSAGEISTDEAQRVIEEIEHKLGTDQYKFYAGVSYRHCMIWKDGETGLSLTAPHDISNRPIRSFLPANRAILDMMAKSAEVLSGFGSKANSIWLWGEGTKLKIPKFYDKYKLSGAVISAVDLIKGLGISAGLDTIEVEGATGTIDTDFTAKKNACIEALRMGKDFVYLHVEAPDECGHHFDVDNKVRAIELIDEKIVRPLLDELSQFGEFRILLLPDHPTPVAMGTHTSAPVPFVIYDSSNTSDGVSCDTYDEESAQKTGIFINSGHELMDRFLGESLGLRPNPQTL